MEVKQIGNLTENATRNNPNRRRVYDINGLSPTLTSAMGEGGNLQPFVAVGRRLGNIYGFDGGNHAGNVYDDEMLSSTIRTYQGGNQQPMIVAMRGRNPDNPSDRTAGSLTEQRLEPNGQGICNTLTSVQKDNMVLEGVIIDDTQGFESEPRVYTDNSPTLRSERSGLMTVENRYRIRKLTPLECWWLMGFSDADFHKAEAVNSNSQLYKQAGNSIVKNVLMAIFGQMIPGKENLYKEL